MLNLDVLFIHPRNLDPNYLMLPSLELCMMSSLLNVHSFSHKLIDCMINNIEATSIRKYIEIYSAKIICIEGTALNHVEAIKIAEICKKQSRNSLICIRGEIVSFIPEKIMKSNDCIDVILKKETDLTLVHLLNYLKGEKEISEIPNISFRVSENNIVHNPVITEFNNLNDLPVHNRELYDLNKYYMRDSETIVRSSRGCPSNCTFCIKTKMSKFRLFEVGRFCDEIKFLQQKGFKSFFFSDDTFAFSQTRILEFLEEIKRRKMNIKFTSNLRIKDISNERISALKEAGAYRVFVGIETINSDSSKILNKDLCQDLINEKIEILKLHNIEFHASFILGSPGDSEDDLVATINFVKEIKPTLVTFNQLKLFPGTPIYDDPDNYGIICDEKDWFENENWISTPMVGTIEIPPSKMNDWSMRLLNEFIN